MFCVLSILVQIKSVSQSVSQSLHPFSHILTIYSRIGAPIVTPPSDNFDNCSILWKALFFRKKHCKQRLNRPTNTDAMSFGSNTTHTKAVDGRRALFSKKSEKHHISSSRADVRRAISTKFCMVIEVVRAIISGPILFLGPIHSFAARGRRKFG